MIPLWQGALAGYGIAIPVGAIAVLILDLSLRRGFRLGFAAGAGAASADWIYAMLAAVAGTALGIVLRPFAIPLAVASGAFLIALGARGVWRARRSLATENTPAADGRSPWLVFIQFLGLTLLNPLTIVYFAALVLGSSMRTGWTPIDSLQFALGAGLASLSWQTLLAVAGSQAGRRLPARSRLITSLVGNLVVLALGLRVLIQAFLL